MSIVRVLLALGVLAAPAAAQTSGTRNGAGAPPSRRQAGQRGAREYGKLPLALPSAQAVGGDEEVVERIFEKFFEAQGTVRAMAKVQTRIIRGYVNHSKSNQPGTVEYYAKAPNKSLAVLIIPGGAQILEGFDGSAGWLQTPFAGAFVFDQTSATILDRDSEFQRKRAREMYVSTKYKGRSEVDGRPVEVVEAVRAGHTPQVLYFDAKGGLLVRSDVVLPARDGEKGVPATVFFDSYAEVDGVKLPVSIRFVYPAYTMTIKVYEVKHNVQISDALFDRPKTSKAN